VLPARVPKIFGKIFEPLFDSALDFRELALEIFSAAEFFERVQLVELHEQVDGFLGNLQFFELVQKIRSPDGPDSGFRRPDARLHRFESSERETQNKRLEGFARDKKLFVFFRHKTKKGE
jgi:hypothetical protein